MTVPLFKMQHRETVPLFKIHHRGTVPLFKMHHRGTVLLFKMHQGGTVPAFKKLNVGTLRNENKLSQKVRYGGGREGGWLKVGDFPLAFVCSWDVGDNRKKARSTHRRVGPKARLMAGPLGPGRT